LKRLDSGKSRVTQARLKKPRAAAEPERRGAQGEAAEADRPGPVRRLAELKVQFAGPGQGQADERQSPCLTDAESG
jgi:hypothetical protein